MDMPAGFLAQILRIALIPVSMLLVGLGLVFGFGSYCDEREISSCGAYLAVGAIAGGLVFSSVLSRALARAFTRMSASPASRTHRWIALVAFSVAVVVVAWFAWIGWKIIRYEG
jgi:hypothetical protein